MTAEFFGGRPKKKFIGHSDIIIRYRSNCIIDREGEFNIRLFFRHFAVLTKKWCHLTLNFYAPYLFARDP